MAHSIAITNMRQIIGRRCDHRLGVVAVSLDHKGIGCKYCGYVLSPDEEVTELVAEIATATIGTARELVERLTKAEVEKNG